MRSRRGLAISSLVSLIIIPALINLVTGGMPKSWGPFQWMITVVAIAMAAVIGLRDRSGPPQPPSLERVVEDLARAVHIQWTEEVSVRRLNDPDPLPIRWRPAPPGLMAPLPQLRETALEWWPATESRVRDRWAVAPVDLAGTDLDLLDVLLHRVPTRRLVVLGGIGSGKTVALVRLVLQLLELRHSEDSPEAVPVMYSLASWDPTQTGLYEWLEARLANDHPALREPASASDGVSWARELIDRHLLLPVLDGFDELPAELRAAARDGINDELRRDAGFVLSCRTADFMAVARPEGGAAERLHATAAVEIEPLSPDAALAYLVADAGGDERWAPVFAAMGTSAALGETFTTPLQVGLARTIYNPRPREPLERLPDPAELADADRFPDLATIDRHLFAGFLPAAYRQFPGQRLPPLCTAERAAGWLAFLAGWMENRPADPGGTGLA